MAPNIQNKNPCIEGMEIDAKWNEVIIKVGESRFTCDRSDLAAISGYFRRLFDNENFIESTSKEMSIYGPIGDEFTSQAIQILLGLCDADEQLSLADIEDLLIVIDYLQVEHLTLNCVRHLKNSITYDTWIFMYRLARELCASDLESACMEHFRMTTGDIDYNQVHISEFENIVQTLKSTVQTTCVFQAIINWVKCNDDQAMLEELLKYVDFKSMDETYIKDIVLTEKVIADREDLVDLIHRISTDRKFLMVGGYETSKLVATYSPINGQVTNRRSPSYPCDRSAVALCANKVIVAGGAGSSMAKIQVYDIESDTWSVSETVLKTPRYGAKAVTVKSKIYIVGGNDGKSCLSSIEILEMVDGVVVQSDASRTPSLKIARCDHTLVVRGDDIFVVGGYNRTSDKAPQERLSSCEVVNVMSNERSDIAPLNESRSSHSAVLVDDSMIVTSGFGDGSRFTRITSVERYSFSSNTWTFLAPLTTARAGHCSRVLNGKVYVIGGAFPNTIECLDTNPPADSLSKLLSYVGLCKPTWNIHQNLSIPSYRSAIVQI